MTVRRRRFYSLNVPSEGFFCRQLRQACGFSSSAKMELCGAWCVFHALHEMRRNTKMHICTHLKVSRRTSAAHVTRQVSVSCWCLARPSETPSNSRDCPVLGEPPLPLQKRIGGMFLAKQRRVGYVRMSAVSIATPTQTRRRHRSSSSPQHCSTTSDHQPRSEVLSLLAFGIDFRFSRLSFVLPVQFFWYSFWTH